MAILDASVTLWSSLIEGFARYAQALNTELSAMRDGQRDAPQAARRLSRLGLEHARGLADVVRRSARTLDDAAKKGRRRSRRHGRIID